MAIVQHQPATAWMVADRLQDLIEVIGPHDANGILQLDRHQQAVVDYFLEWLEDHLADDD